MKEENIIINMASKEELINFFIEGLKESFVSKYDKINSSKDTVNNYMKELNFNYEYDYNTFCSEFIEQSKLELNKLSEEDINNITNINSIIGNIIINMIKLKIFNTVKDDKERTTLMMLHELKKYLMRKSK